MKYLNLTSIPKKLAETSTYSIVDKANDKTTFYYRNIFLVYAP